MPDALQKDPRAFSLTVYHEMQPVFVSNSYSEGWDGTLRWPDSCTRYGMFMGTGYLRPRRFGKRILQR